MRKLFRHPIAVMTYIVIMSLIILAFLSTGETAFLWIGFVFGIIVLGLAGIGKPLREDEEITGPRADVDYNDGGTY